MNNPIQLLLVISQPNVDVLGSSLDHQTAPSRTDTGISKNPCFTHMLTQMRGVLNFRKISALSRCLVHVY